MATLSVPTRLSAQGAALCDAATTSSKKAGVTNLVTTVIYDLPIAVASRLSWLAPLVVRITVGWLFVSTGWGKLHDLQKVIDYFTELGIPYAQYQAPFASANEFVCGLLVLVGLATRVAAIPLIIVMFVAIKTAQWGNVDSLASFFGLTEWAYVTIFAWLAISGPGPISLDRLIASATNRQEV